MMGRNILLISLLLLALSASAQQPVEKTNDLKVYMHYMPWFETPQTIGRWGWHWTMNTRNPNRITDGKREIAAHYYPLIGPYASRDKDVIEYHLLLMKLAGIDGVLINWYGTQGSNGDIEPLLTSSNAIISQVDDIGLEFGVIMEDRFSRSAEDVKANLRYLQNNYFSNPSYIRYGAEQDPLVGIFGPITIQQPDLWAEIMPSAGEELEFLTLWYESGEAGPQADGEYSWVYQDSRDHLDHLQSFYSGRTRQLKTVMGSAYPGFHDYYEEGGSGSGYFLIPHNAGATLDATLALATQYRNQVDMLQLVTWNDFGEGTMLEPTLEFGFEYLKKIQAFTGVSYGEEELEQVYKLYQLRKQHADEPEIQAQLTQAATHFANLEIEAAIAILDAYALGLFDGNKQGRNQHGLQFSIYPNPLQEAVLQVRLQEQSLQAGRMLLLDLSGKRMLSQAYQGGTQDLSLSLEGIANGVYILQLQTGRQVGTQRLFLNR